MCPRITLIYTWHEQAIIEWSWHVIFTVTCCHSVKLCALAARAFQSQHGAELRLWHNPIRYFKIWKVYEQNCEHNRHRKWMWGVHLQNLWYKMSIWFHLQRDLMTVWNVHPDQWLETRINKKALGLSASAVNMKQKQREASEKAFSSNTSHKRYYLVPR